MTPERTRELLENCAKALGGKFLEGTCRKRTGDTWDTWEWCGPIGIEMPDGRCLFPHTDQGHYSEMEAKLRLDVDWATYCVGVGGCAELYADHPTPQLARMMAGCRAAEQIYSERGK